MKQFKDVDTYISVHDDFVRTQLEHIRHIILKTVPKAEEHISYGMPAYAYHGVLLYFAATRQHIGLYPMPSAVMAFKKELAPYPTSKGTIRFPIDQPVPKKLITAIVKFRKLENEEKVKTKR